MNNQVIFCFCALDTKQQVLLVAILCLTTAGIVRQIYLCLCFWILDSRFVDRFLINASQYVELFINNGDNNLQAHYIVRKCHKFTDILGRDRIDYPEIELKNSIKYNSVHSASGYDQVLRSLAVVQLEWDEKRKTKRWINLLELIIPIFWLFRGMECVFMLLAYLLNELGIEIVKVDGGFVRILSIIFTIITGLASLFSYLHWDI